MTVIDEFDLDVAIHVPTAADPRLSVTPDEDDDTAGCSEADNEDCDGGGGETDAFCAGSEGCLTTGCKLTEHACKPA